MMCPATTTPALAEVWRDFHGEAMFTHCVPAHGYSVPSGSASAAPLAPDATLP
jgi:hypothetical protein